MVNSRKRGSIVPIEWREHEAPLRNGIALWDFSAARHGTPRPRPEEPSAEKEQRRAQLMQEFRSRYAEICHQVLGLAKPPADSIDRWLLEQLAQRGGGRDPLVPRPRIAESSRVLERELLAEVPMRCHSRVTGRLASEQLARYVKSARDWLQRLQEPSQLISEEVEALDAWLKEHGDEWKVGRKSSADCPFRRKLDELVAQEHMGLSVRFRVAAQDMAVEILKRVSDEAESMVVQLCEFKASDVYPVHLDMEGAAPKIIFREEEMKISAMHMQKLHQLYEVHQGPGDSEDWKAAFRRRLYCMLRRYVTFIGLDPAEEGSQGGNMHAAAPECVFAWLRDEMGVSAELFASPLNCFFAEYYSAFPDVDAFFGSQGSFFDLDDLPEGSYEVGPPYTEEVMELMARKLLKHLRSSAEKKQVLSFVVFVPDWGDECTALGLVSGEDFQPFRPELCKKQAYLLARGREHHYISGVQFFHDSGADASRRYYDVPHGTRIYVLQTPKAAERWPFGQAKAEALLAKLGPVEEKKGTTEALKDHSHGPPFVGNESERQPVTCQPVAASRRVPRFLANECNNVGDKWAEKHAF
ncbi:unnamed protein product [Durusdinium trenchii]|uniref:PCIF1 WW domain-containing protein n=1 Tax=Durusdinium trenchii TaxID=1381693 RepID=A0ABP0HRJ6_9DINO